ncbi:PP2C family protein-serine/threonine phosphatase [Actinomadura sp. 21ATH]|uniref:PP2C family protein-serine/threonine phosphatase n=1 Tax=Actinomadura sp. 21ATH TaxID=1735444 RepID=UPI0035BEE4F6
MLEGAPQPALVVAREGMLAAANAAARDLFPDARPGAALAAVAPEWLARAHRANTAAGTREPAAGPVGERGFTAYPAEAGSGTVWWLADDTAAIRAERALRRERERGALLAETSRRLLSSLDFGHCLETAAVLAARHLADAALVIGPASARGYPVAFCRSAGPAVRRDLRLDPADVPGLAETLEGLPPPRSTWVEPASVPPGELETLDGFAGFGAFRSLLVTPLTGHGAPLGVLILLRGGSGPAGGFGEDEEAFARLFAGIAGAAISAGRLCEEKNSITDLLARELAPPRVRRLDGAELAAGCVVASADDKIGGDFYEIFPAAGRSRRSLVVLGDVCGKSLEAAIVTGKLRAALRVLLPMADDHPRVLGLLNGLLLALGPADQDPRFATLVLASIRRVDAGVRLRLTAAGHPPPLIVRTDGRVERAPGRGDLIGCMEEIESRTVTTVLRPGDTCLLYTDGVTEARNRAAGGEMFGERRLRDVLAGCAGVPCEAVVERVQTLASRWVGGGDHDDMAVVAISAARGEAPAGT